MFLSINVKCKNNDQQFKPQWVEGSDWLDLRAAEDIELKQGEQTLIPLGVVISLPPGFEANIVPRGSSFKNWGFLQTNSFAVVDESYKGENDWWFYPVYATRDTSIKKGDRICQFRINKKQPRFIINHVLNISNPDRGGHGSTGVN